MKILALELSTARGGLCWLDGGVEVVRDWPNDRKNSSTFFANLDAVTKTFGSPDIVVVGLGPGSYAGTRIAISAGTGLQVASNARLIGFPSICIMECDVQEYCVIGDARRKSFFFARIRIHDLIEGPDLFGEEELKAKLVTVKDDMPVFCSEVLLQFEQTVIRYPSAALLARLARDARRGFSLPPLEPIYLRAPYITTPKVA
jgi:tRNA threonylcarbamoyl adenosine modification protein YeaZ